MQRETEHENNWFNELTKEIGPGSNYAKNFAKKEGNALFAAFMKELNNATPTNNALKALVVERATAKEYHDFEGDRLKIGLSFDLRQAGLVDLAKRVEEGEFDF